MTCCAGEKEVRTSWPTAFSRTRGREVLDDLEVDVGLEERRPDLLERLVDVELGEVALAAKLLEDALEPIGEGFEHRPGAESIRPAERRRGPTHSWA